MFLRITIWLLLFSFSGFSQTYNITGRVIDDKDTGSLIGVTVIITKPADTTFKTGTITDADGNFQIAGLAPGQYALRFEYISYTQANRPVNIADGDVHVGTIKMKSKATELKGVTVTEQQLRAQQKGDTSQFNAGAFKTNPDASAEDLISKMPGVTSDNTGVKVNGEAVQQVYVDGKPFFGTDPSLALKNLPSEIIDKIQVFDKLSDQANFTGFDDGSGQKTLNIITKRGKNEGVFGKVYAGYGTDERYQAGGNLNIFKGDRRITILGMSNNINQQNFSSEDLLGVSSASSGRNRGGSRGDRGGGWSGGRGGGGNPSDNFMIGQQGGITTTHSLGLNYSDNWGKKMKVSGSYFFNSTDNGNTTDIVRNYFTATSGSTSGENVYRETFSSTASNMNHRLNLRFEYTIDSFNTITFTPGISFQQNSNTNNTDANTRIGDILYSTTKVHATADNSGYNSTNNLLIQHKFKKPRRTISLNINGGANAKTGTGTYVSENVFVADTLTIPRDQNSTLDNSGYNVSPNVSYTEPIGKNGQLMGNYNPSYTYSSIDKRTYDGIVLNDTFSNTYNNTYITQKGGLSYRISDKVYTFNVGANVQYATLHGDQTYPRLLMIDRNFTNVLPNAFFNRRYDDGRNLRIMYRTNTHAPSISQLQNVLDISNPILLKTGNADLKQDYEHSFIVRYGATKSKTARSFHLNLYTNYITDYVGNATIIANRADTIFVDKNDTITLRKGSQLSRPENMDGYMSGRLFLTYGLPVPFIKCNLNLSGGFNYARIPGRINGLNNFSDNYIPSGGVVLSSNISEKLDFTLSYFGSYNIVKNTYQSQSNNNYYNHTASLRFNWLFLKHFVLNTTITENYYTAFDNAADQNFFLWNAYLGYKFLKNDAMEARVLVYDILNQNSSISRTVTETYIENSVTQVLKQYFMFQLTYTIRNFKGSMTMPVDDKGGDSRPTRDRNRQ
ncbi:MAG: hypothetical protein K0Q79_2272 [Flavipsychrobacter sp.]|jgi:hypothetical protein|nr:hypothetical protein [Flavipsychrobacter sp.]